MEILEARSGFDIGIVVIILDKRNRKLLWVEIYD
jgi:hypothetical protein